MKKSYYVLGVGFKENDIEKSHPYEVLLDTQESQAPIVMLEGKGMGGVGGNFTPSELLHEQWREHMEISNTLWLLPILEFAANNNDIIDQQLVTETYLHKFKLPLEIKEH